MRSTQNKGAYKTINSFIHDKSSSFGLFNESQGHHDQSPSTRQGQDHGYNMLLSEHMSKPGFNATQPRFNYVKDELRRAEVPGPGTYNRFSTQDAK